MDGKTDKCGKCEGRRGFGGRPCREANEGWRVVACQPNAWREMANGRIGDAVAPRIFRGEAMNKNSYT